MSENKCCILVNTMCLAVPALITQIDGFMACADMGGVETSVNILFTPEVQVGEYVIIHAGYAISVMNGDEAARTLSLFKEMTDTHEKE
jgi:hydrogenase expression/formation protein HypC